MTSSSSKTSNKSSSKKHAVSTKRTFQVGAVTRIKLENFMTYDSCEVIPGPNLNMMIGPNGTGKSSIVCAICLGLAGKTSILGRASHVGEYVKHGHDSCAVEIDLQNSDGHTLNIRRVIHKNNASDWTINGRTTNLKTVEDKVKSLNIQVSNLCQFLPQDRVSDFVKMTPQELLVNTEKAIGQMEMYKNHCALKDSSSKSKELDLALKRAKENLEKEKQKNVAVHDEVQSFRAQDEIRKKMNYMKMKRPWLEYNVVRQEYVQVKEKKDIMGAKLKSEQTKFQPLENKVEKKKQEVLQIGKDVHNCTTAIQNIIGKVRNGSRQIEACTEKIADAQRDLTAKKNDEAQRLKRVKLLKQQLGSLKTSFEEINNNEVEVQPIIDNVSGRIQELTRNFGNAQYEKNNVMEQKLAVGREIDANEAALRELQDVDKLKMEMMRRKNKNAYMAYRWLEQNRDKFKKGIHGPIMMSLNMKDVKYAKYVEKHISYNDMMAFVCEDSTDMNNFIKFVRHEQNIKINAVLMPSQSVASFHQQPIEHYRQWGFECFMKDAIVAADTVMAYLCKQYRIHNVLIGNQYTKDNINSVLQQSKLDYFYTANHQYVVKKSKYNNSQSIRSIEITTPSLLTHSVDQVRRNELVDENKELCRRHSEKEKIYQALRKDEMRLAAELEESRQKKKEMTTQRDHKKSIEVKIKQKEQMIAQIDKDGIDMQAETAAMANRIARINDNKMELIEAYQANIDRLTSAFCTKINKCVAHGLATCVAMKCEERLRDATSSLDGLQSEFDEINTNVKKKKDEAKELLKRASKATGTNLNEDLPQDLQQAFVNLPNTVHEIDALYHDKQAQIDCLLHTNVSVVREYEEREKQIGQLAETVEKQQNELSQFSHNMDELKEKWLPDLEMLIDNINKNFSEFLSSLGCAGQVSIKHEGDPDDYAKYGISIKVKYRDAEQLQELSSHQQSGGERSVATVLYLLALQELTRCPFRCIDEINQGMDSTNERKVFELVVRIACQDNYSQYFLLTPKLLPDLKYSEDMSLLCIYNGSKMVDYKRFNTSRYIKRRKKLLTE